MTCNTQKILTHFNQNDGEKQTDKDANYQNSFNKSSYLQSLSNMTCNRPTQKILTHFNQKDGQADTKMLIIRWSLR